MNAVSQLVVTRWVRRVKSEWVLTILRHAALAEHIDHALFDEQVGSAGRRREAERHHQRSRGAAVGYRDGVCFQRVVPVAHPQLDRGITLATRPQSAPFVAYAACVQLGM